MSSIHNTTDFVAYEYKSLEIDREFEPLYKDVYRCFGWIVEAYNPTLPRVNRAVLKLKRDRRIPHRNEVQELQRTSENALTSIAQLERSKVTIPTVTALGIGMVGTVFLAGSVFAITANLWLLGIPLGIVGLAGWAAGYLSFGRSQHSRTMKVAEQIDREYETIYAAGERARLLLS